MPDSNRQVVLRSRPEGLVKPDDVELITAPIPAIGDGEALMQVQYLGMDATVRTWLSRGEGYLPPVEFGEPVRGSGIGTIVASNCERFPVGSLAYGLPGWQDYAVVRDDGFTNPATPGVAPPALLSVIGATGVTAYVGMLEVGAIKEGETVVVSAAAGATGSLAAQIAKIHGCRVVGICGSDEKCAWIVDDLGIDAAINYRTDDVAAKLKELCPKGVDVYFDNVGGPILDAVLGRIAQHGRVVLCGAISVYNNTGRPPGPSNYLNLISRRGRMEGFLSLDCIPRYPEIGAQLGEWVAAGRLKYRTHTYHGLESAVDALNAMFTGDNIGKIVIEL